MSPSDVMISGSRNPKFYLDEQDNKITSISVL
jgi:hypothetical protein